MNCGYLQYMTVASARLLKGVDQIVHQVNAIRDVNRSRSTTPRRPRAIGAGEVNPGIRLGSGLRPLLCRDREGVGTAAVPRRCYSGLAGNQPRPSITDRRSAQHDVRDGSPATKR